MASIEFSLEDATRSLLEDGFFAMEDANIGELVSEMERRGFPYSSEYGLDFCNDHVLGDPRIRTVLESVFERCTLGHWLRYEQYPGHIVCLRRPGPKAGRRVLTVHLWARGSLVEYYRGSHLHELPVEKEKKSLYRIHEAALDQAGCPAVEKTFTVGGLAILDARLGYEIKKGYTITFMFATDDVLAGWTKMILPYSQELANKVAAMESTKIGVNFAFDTGNTSK
ncbi:hypothetical protein B0T17DRAFT_486756 [Bombardia bombarda]|uniref:Uncharacterized protein n=1 Tax=Bombardia bombarda TaxID=252184 RepID=A0AA39X6N6_9PEZI|nr:hypothetical protein B0T17DRAFT_486756 [Bombardia bombarda]